MSGNFARIHGMTPRMHQTQPRRLDAQSQHAEGADWPTVTLADAYPLDSHAPRNHPDARPVRLRAHRAAK